jgi:hypothetical protein
MVAQSNSRRLTTEGHTYRWTIPAAVVSLLIAATGGFFAGRKSQRDTPFQSPGETSQGADLVDPGTKVEKPVRNGYPNYQDLPLFVAANSTDETCIPVDKKATSTWMMEGITTSVRVNPNFGKGDPERTANESREYVRGLGHAIRALGPDLLEPMREELKENLCKGGQSADELVLLGYLQQELPEVASREGFDCVFAAHKTEDIVTWSMLDAWQQSQVGETSSISSRQAEWSDPRTLRRLEPFAQRQAEDRKVLLRLSAERRSGPSIP